MLSTIKPVPLAAITATLSATPAPSHNLRLSKLTPQALTSAHGFTLELP